ncbi:MAG: pyridoxal phosphate-dependent aminotransferase, partial [Caldimonas sp.]
MNVPSNAVRRVTNVSLRNMLRATVPDTVSLAIGEPSFDTPEVIREAMVRALAAGETHYSDPLGLVALRQAIATDEQRPRRTLSTKEVLITHGGSAGLAAIILGTVNPGDIVAIEDPTYSLYADLVAMAGGQIATFQRGVDGMLETSSVSAAARDAALVIVCQPSNPTGAILSRTDWEFLEQATRERNTPIVSDEAYSNLIYDDRKFVSVLDVPGLESRGVLCQTFSKKFAMTGWRIGYLIGAEKLVAAAYIAHRTFNGAVNTAVQHAAIAAIAQAQPAAAGMRDVYTQRRSEMANALASVKGLKAVLPAGAF